MARKQPPSPISVENGWISCDGALDETSERLLSTVKSHASLILPVVLNGQLAGVVHGEVLPEMKEALNHLGWDGKSPVFMPGIQALMGMARTLDEMGDLAGRDFWVAGSNGRIVVFYGYAAVMFHYDPERGYWASPSGSSLN